MTQQEKLKTWLKSKIDIAKKEGVEFFMGVPDSWYEGKLHCCNNGHIGSMYLKTEKGAVCLTCHQPSSMFPDDATQEELNEALK